MTSQTPFGPEHQNLDRRTVRDIVEYSPSQVNEVWCRKIFRRILQSLELQYGMHMPHRAITPDTVVFHDNGEPLLVPSELQAAPRRDGAAGDPLRDDLTALAGVVHYAITGELLPEGPLHGRGFTGYSDALLSAVDRCMAPDPDQRPRTIEEMREILGIVPPGQPPAPRPLPEELFDDVGPDLAPAAGPVAAPEPEAVSTTAAAPETPEIPAPAPAPGTPAEAPVTFAAAAPAPEPLAAPAAAPHPLPAADTGGRPVVASRPAAPLPPITPVPAGMRTPGKPRFGGGLSPRQRFAIVAGGGAILVAFALVMFAEMRDAGSYDQVALSLPQHADAPAPAAAPPQETAAAAPATPPDAAAPGGAAPGVPVPVPMPDGAVAYEPSTGTAPAALPGATGTPNAPAGAAGGATYRLQILPWGVVYVDGVDRGVSPPVKRLALAPGRHTVRVTNPNFQDRMLEIDTANGNGRITIDFSKEPAPTPAPAANAAAGGATNTVANPAAAAPEPTQ